MLDKLSKTLSLGVLSVVLLSGCSEGGVLETKSTTDTNQSDSVSVGESVSISISHSERIISLRISNTTTRRKCHLNYQTEKS